MKKYYSILFAAAILSAVACNKEELVDPNEGMGDAVEMSFKAYTEATKAALDVDAVAWSSDDAISVFADGYNNQFAVSSVENDGHIATFSGSAIRTSTYYGVFPYNAETTVSNGEIHTVIPAVQSAVAGSFGDNAAIAVAKTTNKEFEFKNATALLALGSNMGLASIKVESTEGKALAGAVCISFDAEGVPTVESETGSAVEIAGTIAAGSTYYVAVVPGTYTGLKITFTKADGSFATKTNNNEITFNRNDLVNLPAFTLADSDFHAALQSYVLNGYAEVAAFLNGYDASVREDVLNLTVTGNDVTKDQVANLYYRVGNIYGTLTIDGTGTNQYNSGDWDDSIHFALERMHCKGSIVIKNILGIMKLTALKEYNGVINGDFIVENCPRMVTNWDDDGVQTLVEIKGDYKIIGKDGGFNANTFKNLKKIGGDFVFTGNSSIWNLSDYDSEHPLEYIGGNIIIENNSALWNINGLENLKHIGGNVTIRNNNSKFPKVNGWVDGSQCRGYCTVKEWMANGVLSADATVVLGTTDTPIDVNSLSPCTSSSKASYVLRSNAEVAAFLNAGISGETVINLTVSGSDITGNQVNNLRGRVSHIEGTLTIENISSEDGNIKTSYLADMDLQGGIIIRNTECTIEPGGNSFPTHVKGDFVLQNLPNLLINDGWGSGSWGKIEQVDGDLVFDGCCSAIWRGNFFTSLQSVGGNFEIGNLPKSYLTAPALTHIGGDLVFHDIDQGEWMTWGEDGFFALESVGGKIVFRNITGGLGTGSFPVLTTVGGIVYDNVPVSRGLLSAVTTVNGDFEMTAVKNWILFENLKTVTGNVNIHDCPDKFFSESSDGMPALETVGGNFILKNLAGDNYLIFTKLATVGGDFVMDNVLANSFNHSSTKLMFDNLTRVGGSFKMVNIESGTLYLRFAGLQRVGKNLTLDSIPSDVFMHGDTREGFPALTAIGGNLTVQNFVGSTSKDGGSGTNYDSWRVFKSLKTIGGDFTINNMEGLKRFYDNVDGSLSMDLTSIGGDLVITSAAFKSFNGMNHLTRIGGNVVVNNCASSWVTNTSDQSNIGFCLIKEYVDAGVISSTASVSIPMELSTLSACTKRF